MSGCVKSSRGDGAGLHQLGEKDDKPDWISRPIFRAVSLAEIYTVWKNGFKHV